MDHSRCRTVFRSSYVALSALPSLARCRIVWLVALLVVGLLVSPRTSQAQTFHSLYSFIALSANGQNPISGLIQASDGYLYGTTQFGGTDSRTTSIGTIYRISPDGTNHTVLHAFDKSITGPTASGVIQASDGKLYGMTPTGGTNKKGSIYRMNLDGTGFTIIHSFNTTDGILPQSDLVQASDGNLYGTTSAGGANDVGTVFRITLSGTFTAIHSFNTTDGDTPISALIQGSDGNLYGTTTAGGDNGIGTVFRISTSGTLTTLHSFNGTDGSFLIGRLIQASDGKLYGTTRSGGTYSRGTVFGIGIDGTRFTTLHSFDDPTSPGVYTGVIEASDGYLYGTAFLGGTEAIGSIYRLSTSGTFTTIHSFNGTDGQIPYGNLLQASNGSIYGTTLEGGADGTGTIYTVILGTGPVITDLSPDHVMVGSPTFTLTVNGSQFDSTAVVHWNGSPLATTFVSDTQLTATVPSTLLTNSGTSSVTVSQLGSVSNERIFTVSYPLSTITSISPSSTEAGHKAFTMTVTGSDFLSLSKVFWNGLQLTTTYVSGTQLTAQVPASLVADPGTATITVQNDIGSISNSKIFTIHVTVLKIISATVTKDGSGNYTVNFTLKNVGNVAAPNASMISASLGAAATTTSLPLSLGTVAAGATVPVSLVFPASAGTSGSTVTLSERCLFTNAGTNSVFQITLP